MRRMPATQNEGSFTFVDSYLVVSFSFGSSDAVNGGTVGKDQAVASGKLAAFRAKALNGSLARCG
jgi:hypothetical protein